MFPVERTPYCARLPGDAPKRRRAVLRRVAPGAALLLGRLVRRHAVRGVRRRGRLGRPAPLLARRRRHERLPGHLMGVCGGVGPMSRCARRGALDARSALAWAKWRWSFGEVQLSLSLASQFTCLRECTSRCVSRLRKGGEFAVGEGWGGEGRARGFIADAAIDVER